MDTQRVKRAMRGRFGGPLRAGYHRAETLKQENPAERRIGFAISQNAGAEPRALDLPVVAQAVDGMR